MQSYSNMQENLGKFSFEMHKINTSAQILDDTCLQMYKLLRDDRYKSIANTIKFVQSEPTKYECDCDSEYKYTCTNCLSYENELDCWDEFLGKSPKAINKILMQTKQNNERVSVDLLKLITENEQVMASKLSLAKKILLEFI